jgi:hypothetical protein
MFPPSPPPLRVGFSGGGGSIFGVSFGAGRHTGAHKPIAPMLKETALVCGSLKHLPRAPGLLLSDT